MQNKLARTILFAAGIVMLFAISYVGGIVLRSSTFGFNPGEDAVGLVYVYVSLWTLLGVVCSVVVSILRAMPQDAPVNLARLLSGLLYPRTFIALCVSPFVFFGALAAVHADSVSFLTYLGAFQNGFFWQQMLATQEGAHAPVGASAINGRSA